MATARPMPRRIKELIEAAQSRQTKLERLPAMTLPPMTPAPSGAKGPGGQGLSALASGTVVGRFQVETLLGQGGMGAGLSGLGSSARTAGGFEGHPAG